MVTVDGTCMHTHTNTQAHDLGRWKKACDAGVFFSCISCCCCCSKSIRPGKGKDLKAFYQPLVASLCVIDLRNPPGSSTRRRGNESRPHRECPDGIERPGERESRAQNVDREGKARLNRDEWRKVFVRNGQIVGVFGKRKSLSSKKRALECCWNGVFVWEIIHVEKGIAKPLVQVIVPF